MEDKITEKVYCYDHPSAYGNHDALLATVLNQRNQDPMALAAMMNGGMNGGMNGQWNNPFIYLVWMMFAGRFFNGNGFGGNEQATQNVEMASQLQAIRSQMQDNQNSGLIMDAIKGNAGAINQLASNLNCDFNTLNSCCCDVRNGINKLSGEVGFSAERIINSISQGDCHIIEAVKDCCCTTQKELLRIQASQQLQMCEQTNAIQNGQRDLQVALDKGLATSAFEMQRQTCDLVNNQNANTQRIIDTLNGHWKSELENKLQEEKFEKSQLKQNIYLAGLIKGDACGGCGGMQ